MQKQDYYAILGIAQTASTREIKRAYRRLARQHHPDLHRDDASAETMMRALNAAIEVLADPGRRAQYDLRQIAGAQANAVYAPQAWGSAPVPLYEPSRERRDGYDANYEITLMPDEAAAGTTCSMQFHASNGQPYIIVATIPAGVTTGARIRVVGKGGPGLNGGRRGDLYIVVRVDTAHCSNGHQDYQRKPR
jgi:curved DNA-binding protein